MIGDAAPVWLPGAIAAISADSRMKNPADAAREPVGVTYESEDLRLAPEARSG